MASPAFDLAAYLADRRAWAEAALEAFVPAADIRPARLHAAMRHSLFAGGKRLRPILCSAAAEACGADHDVARCPAAAIECLHTYTLIHDDLPCMDDDVLRRGRPTCHVAFGYATALLAGDALQALAFRLAAQTPVQAAEIVRDLALAAGSTGVVGGQQEDLDSEHLPPDPGRLRYIQLHKTADLVGTACRMGALAAGRTPAELAPFTDYANAVGEAFQVADDILDVTSTAEAMGKSTGADAAHEKMTAVTVYGLDGARKRLAALTDLAIDALAPLPAPQALRALARHLATRKS